MGSSSVIHILILVAIGATIVTVQFLTKDLPVNKWLRIAIAVLAAIVILRLADNMLGYYLQ